MATMPRTVKHPSPDECTPAERVAAHGDRAHGVRPDGGASQAANQRAEARYCPCLGRVVRPLNGSSYGEDE